MSDDVVPTDDFSGTISLRFERAVVSGPITLDPAPPHLVAGLLLSTITPVDDSLEKVSADLRALPGTVSVLFAPLFDDGDPVLAMAADQQLAIGSTFKLYVLSALAHSIARGERDWSDVVQIDRASYPSGTMHLWPRGSPVTLQTLAIMMISNSDNTATDILLHHLGREMVEAEVVASGHSHPERMQPFLGTLELFALKGSLQNRQKFIAADPAERRRILADFEDDVNGDPAGIIPPRFTSPTAIDTIEWFASVEDIRKAMARIASLEDPVARQIMAIAPSLPDETVQTFAFVGYKGGSEPGVLNLSWLLRDDANDWHVLSMTWNDHDNALQSGTLEVIGQRLLTLSR